MKVDKDKLERFIREKVEKEAWTDAQIAEALNLGTSTISHWRNDFGIRPADKFKRKFKEKYGENAIQEFMNLVENQKTLRDISEHFGFTREYARQVYVKIYGMGKIDRAHTLLSATKVKTHGKKLRIG